MIFNQISSWMTDAITLLSIHLTGNREKDTPALSSYSSKSPPSATRKLHQQGTVLITTVLLVFVVATIGAGMLKLTTSNQRRTEQSVRENQSKKSAKTAVSIAFAKLRADLLPKNPDAGDLSNGKTFSNVGSESIEFIEQRHQNVPDEAYTADAAIDGFDNDNDGIVDNEQSNKYRGTKFRIRIKEWDPNQKIGAAGIDDDNDGTVDETGEVPGTTTEDTRRFTIVATSSTNNFTTRMHAFVQSEITPMGNYALYARDELEIKPNSYFDSYKSGKGSYSSQTPGKEGNIATEASLEIDSNTRIMGDAKWGGSEAEIAHNAYVHGETKKLSDNESYSEPETVHEVLDSFNGGEKTVQNNQEFTVPKDKNYKEIEMNQGSTLNIQEGDEVFIGESDENNGGNNQSINVGNQSTVVIQNGWEIGSGSTLDITGPSDPTKEPTKIIVGEEFEAKPKSEINVSGRVQFHVAGEFTIKPKGEVNTSDDHPYNLTLKVGGTWKTPHGTTHKDTEGSVEIKPKGDVKANLYAPTAELEIKPKGEFFGKVVGNEIEIKPKTKFHHDESICKKNCEIAGCSCSYNTEETTSWVISQQSGPQKGF